MAQRTMDLTLTRFEFLALWNALAAHVENIDADEPEGFKPGELNAAQAVLARMEALVAAEAVVA